MGNKQRWEFFHPLIKEKFLKTQIENENSKMTYSTTLGNISEYERFLGIDIFDMNRSQLKDGFETLTTNTLPTVSTTKSRLANYIEWAISPSVNICKNVNNSGMVLGWLKSCDDDDLVSITAMENQYVTEKEKNDIIDYARNFQDKSLVMLLFRNIGGVKLSEITDMKFTDLNFETNEVHLHGVVKARDKVTKKIVDIIGDRFVQLTTDEMNMLKIAYKTSTYDSWKAVSGSKSSKEDWIGEPLLNNGYIFRKKERKGNDNIYEPIKAQILTQRLKSLVKGEGYEGVGLQKPQIVAKTLGVSGMLNELKNLRSSKGILTDDDFKDVVVKFNAQEENFQTLRKLYNFMIKRNMKFVRAED